ncbi:coiled-coil domain-containing protein 180 [Amblyraja radiata]|uniref:coiled-coil domain-containing protein 180 n=1 Tax=Amblyraja radiata TaxID=386614 RepID=UPI00140291AF|nr:coiled-coil domain-containing protein 180 [Amblyraja radiata]
MGEVRVVPSGKVYRQIFDAEVQLVRTLGETRRKSLCHDNQFGHEKIPIVRNLDTPTGEFLSQRQRSWMEGLMNDGYIENPVLRRDAVLSTTKTKELLDMNNAVMEVKGLPDIISTDPTKVGSSVIQQMTEYKQESHESVIMNMEQKLITVSRDLETQFTQSAQQLLQDIEQSIQNVDGVLSNIEDEGDLPTLTLENLNNIWDQIMKMVKQRKDLIKEFDRTYKEYEKERVKQITAEFKESMKALEKISFLPEDDIYRFFDKEAMLVNQALLANHRAMSKLYINLIKVGLKHEMTNREVWNSKVEKMKIAKRQSILHKLKNYLAKDWEIGFLAEQDLLKRQQQGLNSTRIQLLEEITNIAPSDCKIALKDWYDSLNAINKNIDSLHIKYVEKLQSYYENLYRDWITEIGKCKEELLRSKTCTAKEATQLMVSDFLPLLGNLQRHFENELSAVDKHMENLAQQIEYNCKELFNTSHESSSLWEEHKMNLIELEDQLKEHLDDCRKKHDKTNQAREANLDLHIDHLRQDNTQMELKADYKKVLCLLKKIKKGYEVFHQSQIQVVNKYPSTVKREMQRFSAAVSKYFDVFEVYKMEQPRIIIESPNQDKEVFPTEEAVQEGVSEHIMSESDVSPSVRDEPLAEESNFPDEHSIIQEVEEHLKNELSPQEYLEDGLSLQGYSEDEISVQEQSEDELSLQEHLQDELSVQEPLEEELSVQELDNTLGVHSKISKESKNTSNFADWESSDHPSEYSVEDGNEDDEVFLTDVQMADSQVLSGSRKSMLTLYEYFTTSRGNNYSARCKKKAKLQISIISDLAGTRAAEFLQRSTKHAFLPEELFIDLKRRIRLIYFDHLEEWYGKALENANNIVVAKKTEFQAEMELRTHLHEPRGKRIKMDVLHVRAAELRLHSEKVERHCNAVEETMQKLKKEFAKIQTTHCKSVLDFRNSIYNLEQIFKTATRSDRLVNLLNSLSSKQEKYMDGVNKLLRNFQQKLDKSLGKLQDDNAHFIKSLRLFAEGGNFTATEIDTYRQNVEQEASNIAKIEGTIMVDLEVMESLSIQQSFEVIKEVEDRFMRYTVDLIFIEKIKRFLTNTQARIKSAVAKSNHQLQCIASHLEQLEKKIDACAKPNLDKEYVLSWDLYRFAKTIRDLTKTLAIYLNCLMDPVLIDVPLQGSIATATRIDFLKKESKVSFHVNENLFNPMRKGRNAVEDVAVGVIKELQISHKSEVVSDTVNEDSNEQAKVVGSQVSFFSGSIHGRSNIASSRGQRNVSSPPSATKYTKPNRFDPKYQVFGETAEPSDYYKGTITYILWESTNALLSVAEDYYKKKERTLISRPEYLKDTFEQCAEEVIQKMLSYQVQATDYYNNSLQEFKELLLLFEQLLPAVPQFLIEEILKNHMESFTKSIADKHCAFCKKQQQMANVKVGNKQRLRPILGHPNNLEMLKSLCEEEEERQGTEATEITSNWENLKQCLNEHANNFVFELSKLSELLLLEFDNFLIIDDIEISEVFAAHENDFTLSEWKQSGPQLQEKEAYDKLSVPDDRAGRSWPGIPANELLQVNALSSIKKPVAAGALSAETAAVTTAKNTLAHLATMEARDAAYVKYKQYFLQQMSHVEQEISMQLIDVQRWTQGWKDSVTNIKKLYT